MSDIPECPERGHDLGAAPDTCRVCHDHLYPGACFDCGEHEGTNDDCHACRRYNAELADESRIDAAMGK